MDLVLRTTLCLDRSREHGRKATALISSVHYQRTTSHSLTDRSEGAEEKSIPLAVRQMAMLQRELCGGRDRVALLASERALAASQ